MGPRVLAVTGVPCSGKTVLARRLGSALDVRVIGLSELIEEKRLCSGYDAVRDTKTVDVGRLGEYVAGLIRGDAILDGLLSHHLQVTHILVLRCDPRVLEKRMRERGYAEGKIMENLEAEYTGVILYESLDACENVMEVDNTGGADIREIREWFRRGGRRIIEKDWTPEFQGILESRGCSPI
jgi:adenylate kinase